MLGGQCAVAAKRRLPKPPGVIVESCLTARAQACAIGTDGSRPSIRSAEKKPISPSARMFARCSATNPEAVPGTRPTARYSTPLARALASGCAAPPTAPKPTAGPRATPNALDAPTTAATGAATAPRLRGAGLTASELYTAYRAILDTYVDPVDDKQLIGAAADGLRQELRKQPTLPMIQMPIQLVGGMTGDPDRDWQMFGDA